MFLNHSENPYADCGISLDERYGASLGLDDLWLLRDLALLVGMLGIVHGFRGT